MYKIYFANLGKAVGNPAIGKRPVVSVGCEGEKIVVYPITSRNRKYDKRYVHLNGYMTRGYCCVTERYTIEKKYLLNFWRDCTTSEINAINQKIFKTC